jgi:DNA-binding CsgD family transcriptional regulator
VSCRTVYERASIEALDGLPSIEELIRAGEQARVLPTLPMTLYLADDRFAVLPLHGEPAADAVIVVHRSTLLDFLAKLFRDLWQRALPLDLAAAQPATSRTRSTTDEKRLIALLLSGLTDEAIAHQFGVSHRTIQRRVAALIDDLNVHSRFQAGVQVAIREYAGSVK